MPRPKGSKNKSTLVKQGILPVSALGIPGVQVVTTPVVDTRTDDEIINEIKERFDVYYSMIIGAGQGAITSLVVVGSAGVGKSYTAEWALDHMKNTQGTRYSVVRGHITAIDLYALAYQLRQECDVIVLDDADSIFDDENGLNLLKGLLDTSTDRKVSWMTDHSRFKGDNALPKDFIYRGSMVFLTNKNFQEYIDSGSGRYIEHMNALMSRSIYLDLKMHNRREVSLWMRLLVTKNKILQTLGGVTEEQEKMLVEWIMAHRDNLRELSIRTAIKLGKIFKMNGNDWERVANVCLVKGKHL